jgi:hypothetical protein
MNEFRVRLELETFFQVVQSLKLNTLFEIPK